MLGHRERRRSQGRRKARVGIKVQHKTARVEGAAVGPPSKRDESAHSVMPTCSDCACVQCQCVRPCAPQLSARCSLGGCGRLTFSAAFLFSHRCAAQHLHVEECVGKVRRFERMSPAKRVGRQSCGSNWTSETKTAIIVEVMFNEPAYVNGTRLDVLSEARPTKWGLRVGGGEILALMLLSSFSKLQPGEFSLLSYVPRVLPHSPSAFTAHPHYDTRTLSSHQPCG